MENVPYRLAIGSLMYLATCTRPDLAECVSELSKFSQNLGAVHWEGMKRVLHYLSGTLGAGLLYKRGAQVVVWGYSDSGHATMSRGVLGMSLSVKVGLSAGEAQRLRW